MDPIETWTPGANICYDGRGSTQESSGIALNWASASWGLIQYTQRFVLTQFIGSFGRFPYGADGWTGYRHPMNELRAVDGVLVGPQFPTVPRTQWG